jgi:hypothetical protein
MEDGMTTHRARPFAVTVRRYTAGLEQGFAGITTHDLAHGIYQVASDADGWELTTENFPLERLREKVNWLPGLTLVPFVYARGARHLLLGDTLLVRFPGGLEIPMGPNEVTALFTPVKEIERTET